MRHFAFSIAILLGLTGSVWAGYDEGSAAYKRGDYTTALREFRPLARQGDDRAQYRLAMMYLNGRGVRKDHTKAAKWLRKAAEQGNINAQFSLASSYRRGRGLARDYTKAVKWFRSAAMQGYPWAQRDLGHMYFWGQGVQKNYVWAHLWFNLAASKFRPGKNHNWTINRLAKAEKAMTPAQIVVAQGLAQAIKEYRRTYRRFPDDAFIQGKMRELKQSGTEVRAKKDPGYEAYQRRDYATALREWRALAEQGDASAQYNLAALFVNGYGVPRDLVLAYALFDMAAARKAQAASRRVNIARNMTPVEIERAVSIARNARQGNMAAILRQALDSVLVALQSKSASPERVRKVQDALKGLGYDPGSTNGALGPETHAAIRAYQADVGFAENGRASKRLLTHLEQTVARMSPPQASGTNSMKLVRAGRKLSLADAKVLERKVGKNPDTLWARSKLLGFYFYSSKRLLGRAPTIQARRRHILWLIQKHPEARLANFSEASIDPIGHSLADQEGYQLAKKLWLDQVKDKGDNKKVLLNAAKFLRLHDKELAVDLLTRAGDSTKLGMLYALGVLRVNMMNQNGLPMSVGKTAADHAFAKKARQVLEGSSDFMVVGAAGHFLLTYGVIVRRLQTDPELVDFIETLLKKSGLSMGEYYEFKARLATSPSEKRKFAKLRFAEMEKMRSPPPGAKGHEIYRFERLVKAAFAAGDIQKSGLYANKLLEVGMKPGYEKWRGNALHHGNLILGRIAFKQGRIENAKTYLIKAGRMTGSAKFGAFGPNMALAKELLEAGEKAVVIEYLQICKKFWPYDRKIGKLDRWINTVRAGRIPKFGGNLVY